MCGSSVVCNLCSLLEGSEEVGSCISCDSNFMCSLVVEFDFNVSRGKVFGES